MKMIYKSHKAEILGLYQSHLEDIGIPKNLGFPESPNIHFIHKPSQTAKKRWQATALQISQ